MSVTKSILTRDAAAAESVSASAPESETRLSTQGMRKLNVGGRVAPPLLISPPIGCLHVEDSPQETDPVNRCVGRALISSYGTFCLTFFIDIMHL